MPILWPNDHEETTPIQSWIGFVLLTLWITFILWSLITPF